MFTERLIEKLENNTLRHEVFPDKSLEPVGGMLRMMESETLEGSRLVEGFCRELKAEQHVSLLSCWITRRTSRQSVINYKTITRPENQLRRRVIMQTLINMERTSVSVLIVTRE